MIFLPFAQPKKSVTKSRIDFYPLTAILDICILYENAQGLRTGNHRILNQQVKLVQKILQNIVNITIQDIKRLIILLFVSWTNTLEFRLDGIKINGENNT